MSALALIAKQLGFKVTGSDSGETFITDAPLIAAGIIPLIGFKPEHLSSSVDLVVIGAAYGRDNVEVVSARAKGILMWCYSQFLAYLAQGKKTIAVAGTHGKTTTTAILTYLLYHAKMNPSYVIGTGSVAGLPAHGGAGTGDYFVTEADDYKRTPTDNTPKFLDLSPFAAIITSIEHDHPDIYASVRDVVEAFYNLTLLVPADGFLVVNNDDLNVRKVMARLADRQFITYGLNEGATYRLKPVRTKAADPLKFRLLSQSDSFGPFSLSLYGQHNLYNAAAAVVMAMELGVAGKTIQKLLPNFTAVLRRYQLVGTVGGQVVIDDYAHHPTSVALTLEAARKQYGRRPIWCFFQSHTFSRTNSLLKDFATAFTLADQVIVTDIFASARETNNEVDKLSGTRKLVDEIAKHHGAVRYVPMDQLLSTMEREVPQDAIIITMGAGDIYKVGHAYVAPSTPPPGLLAPSTPPPGTNIANNNEILMKNNE